ncbi:MAG TPA: HlyD family efflux transporter periplasmic adaptor subunit [Chitinispirillaceae bacterium]|nr:HlyD family efflux transporter periplasmic adaptor subunit [Chitinispirillaceae bacterium]
MNKIFQNPLTRWIIISLVIIAIGLTVILLLNKRCNKLPDGIASGNGRIEAEQVEVAAKEPLRVQEVLVAEGDLVKKDQVLVKLNTETLDAELAEANKNVTAVEEKVAITRAAIQRVKSEIELARIEADRARKLVQTGAGSQRDYDIRRSKVKTTTAALAEEEARLNAAEQEVKVAQANVTTIQTHIDDATLVSPVLGRVLYKLTEPGEVVSAGGSVLTLVDLSDVYMEIFLPSNQAAALKIGGEGRITMDYMPGWALPACVSFVSPEAQFTPKQVETESEREMLMFRVRLQIPQELVLHYIEQIKTGVRGIGYVKIDESVQWPEQLQKLLTVYQGKKSPMSNPPEEK